MAKKKAITRRKAPGYSISGGTVRVSGTKQRSFGAKRKEKKRQEKAILDFWHVS